MGKIDQKAEKQLRNEEYGKKFRKTRDAKERKGIGKNWCRLKGHPQSCSCILPTTGEVIAASRKN